jgi:hypothetical protein
MNKIQEHTMSMPSSATIRCMSTRFLQHDDCNTHRILEEKSHHVGLQVFDPEHAPGKALLK